MTHRFAVIRLFGVLLDYDKGVFIRWSSSGWLDHPLLWIGRNLGRLRFTQVSYPLPGVGYNLSAYLK
jgi:hypothetical protein